MQRLLLFLLALAPAACADLPDEPPDTDYVHAAIIRPNCATIGCHSAATAQLDLDLSTPEKACESLGAFPDDVKAYLHGTNDNPNYPRMPPDLPLPATDIAIMDRWLDGVAAGEIPCE